MSVFDFTSLSPDLILDGLESVGFKVDSGLLALNSYENRVYQFHDENLVKYVTKFYRPERWTENQIREELNFALELDNQELPLVPPLCVNGETLFNYQGYYFTVSPCRGGRTFEVDNLEQLEWMGRFIARIHGVSSTKNFELRPALSVDDMLFDASKIIQASGFVPKSLNLPFFTILEQVNEVAAAQYKPKKQIRLHGDCHAGNIFWTDKGPHFVDLDDCKTGPAIQDLWMMLSGDRNEQLLQLDTLLAGYEEFFTFDTSELVLIESLRTMRVVNYMAWLCKRWKDPAFPRNFPWFDSEKYWEQQILMLKEQMSALQQPPLSLIPM
ncbi:serine/threonine protein kinase [Colwellia sp. RE-S-Sl-9]